MNNDMKVCENQVLRFFRYLDERRYESLAGLMAPDGIWHRQGKVLKGPAQVLAAVQSRSPTMRIAHIATSLAVESIAADQCTVHGYMLIIRHDPGVLTADPLPLHGVESVRNLLARLERRDGGWLISELSVEQTIFAKQA